jgi:aromatic-amino-acid transaminase
MGLPTWQNHPQIFARAGLRTGLYCHFDAHTQQLCFDEMLAALERGDPGDAVLLHGCCHNPTGADLSVAQWEAVAETIARRELLPLIDLAYQGLGGGLEEDVVGLRHVLSAVPDVLVAYSCDKNFGLYRERVGALFAVCASRARRDVVADNARALARTNWSMPPDHGAAVVRIVLQNANLAGEWRAELETMRHRLADVRQALAAAVPDLKMLAEHRGLFAQLALGPAQVEAMRRRHGVYMTDTGRINLAGLTASNIPHFAEAYANRQEEVLA